MARYFDNTDEFYVVEAHTEWDYKEAHEVTYYPGQSYEMTRQIPERQADERTYFYGPYTQAGANYVKTYMSQSRLSFDDGVRTTYTVRKGKVAWVE